MKIGLVYPQTEYGNDPAYIRDYAQIAEGLGFNHILAYDHVLGANPDRPDALRGPYTYKSPFQEPFVLFSFMAAATKTIEFTPGIIILPQRQTALVAKQAATLDVLSGGRLRLGIGIGWNHVEYQALGENFKDRGVRSEEQVELMRKLWAEPLVNFAGRWHTIPDAGLNPLPIQRPIPIWFGGRADVVLRRIARIGDGWISNHRSLEEARPALENFERYVAEAGRNREGVGLEARIAYGDGNQERWTSDLEAWRAAGASHLSFNTMASGLETPDDHLGAVRAFAETIGLSG